MPSTNAVKIFCITGMPGSGKSIVSSAFADRGVPVLVMGDLMRKVYSREATEGETLMDFALRMRRDHGPEVVARWTVEEILSKGFTRVVVDGVRSPAEKRAFESVGKVLVIAVHSSPRTRYSRLRSRGRNDDYTNDYKMLERDAKELALGVGEVIAMADYMLVNEGTPQDLLKSVNSLIGDLLD